MYKSCTWRGPISLRNDLAPSPERVELGSTEGDRPVSTRPRAMDSASLP